MDQHQLRILLVDDDEDDYIITRDLLADSTYQFGQAGQSTFELEWAATYETALTKIEQEQHDVYLIDYQLGINTGLDLLREAVDQGCTAPLILLTGQNDRSIDIEAMQAGAADYLVKDNIDAPLLERSIRYAIEQKRAARARAELEEQLRQAQRIEAVGRLAGGVAHDFNNLLTAIMGYASLAADTLPKNHPVRSDIQGIQKIAQRASDLTRQLLTFARRQIVEPQVLNPNVLILNLDKLLRRLIDEDIELITILASDLAHIKIDPGQLEQVLVNLVVNARDAMPNGGKLTIETANIFLDADDVQQHPEIAPGPYVALSVQDNGLGMSEEVKTHIFEPFFTTKEVGKGTGLGLATCFGIISQSEGHIAVESKLYHGTTIHVYLPCVSEDLSLKDNSYQLMNLPQGQETILLVEDEPAVRNLAARVLKHHGYTVLEATNGKEAWRMSNDHAARDIQLLITDVVMPQMGGKILANRLKSVWPDLKVLYISGYSNDTISYEDVQGPGIDFLQKPFAPEKLVQRVRQLLDS